MESPVIIKIFLISSQSIIHRFVICFREPGVLKWNEYSSRTKSREWE